MDGKVVKRTITNLLPLPAETEARLAPPRQRLDGFLRPLVRFLLRHVLRACQAIEFNAHMITGRLDQKHHFNMRTIPPSFAASGVLP